MQGWCKVVRKWKSQVTEKFSVNNKHSICNHCCEPPKGGSSWCKTM